MEIQTQEILNRLKEVKTKENKPTQVEKPVKPAEVKVKI